MNLRSSSGHSSLWTWKSDSQTVSSNVNSRSGFNLLILFVRLPEISAFAQIDKGALSGAVTDNSGAVVAGAKVSAKNIRTGVSQETVSTSSGLYVFPNLEPGTYTISYEQAGFKKLSRSNIVIAVGSVSVASYANFLIEYASSLM